MSKQCGHAHDVHKAMHVMYLAVIVLLFICPCYLRDSCCTHCPGNIVAKEYFWSAVEHLNVPTVSIVLLIEAPVVLEKGMASQAWLLTYHLYSLIPKPHPPKEWPGVHCLRMCLISQNSGNLGYYHIINPTSTVL